jgi:hypothetical protein
MEIRSISSGFVKIMHGTHSVQHLTQGDFSESVFLLITVNIVIASKALSYSFLGKDEDGISK